jgi:hypothetical protein
MLQGTGNVTFVDYQVAQFCRMISSVEHIALSASILDSAAATH